MVATRWNKNSWESSHEEKWWRVSINMEWKVPMDHEENIMGINKPRLMDGGEDESSQKYFDFKGIERQQEKR